MAGSGAAVLVSAGDVWSVSARAGKAGHSDPLMKMMGENTSASGQKTTGEMAWQRVRAASWASSIVWLTLVVSLGAVGARFGPQLQQFSDGQPLVQGLLADRHGQALACTHLTPVRCIQHWGIGRGTGPYIAAGSVFLGGLCRRRQRRRSAIVQSMINNNQ